jgi:hypothetical protein
MKLTFGAKFRDQNNYFAEGTSPSSKTLHTLKIMFTTIQALHKQYDSVMIHTKVNHAASNS